MQRCLGNGKFPQHSFSLILFRRRSKTVQPRILNSLLRLIAVPDPLVYQLFVSMLFRTRSLC